MTKKQEPKDVSISIGGEEILVGVETKNQDGVTFKIGPDSKFKFEFDGLIADKFVVKKWHDFKDLKNITEIHLERGIAPNVEIIPLVRITHF